MRRFWVGVASAAHVRLGRAGGFMQLGHGKRSPLLRLKPGDGIVYYSPSTVFGQADGLRSFTAIGQVLPGEVYQGNMGAGFEPHRRDVAWAQAREHPILPLLPQLELTRGKASWGMVFRYGLVTISAGDFERIAEAMEVAWPQAQPNQLA